MRLKHEQMGAVEPLSSAICICDLGKEGVKWDEGSQIPEWLGREAGRAPIEWQGQGGDQVLCLDRGVFLPAGAPPTVSILF